MEDKLFDTQSKRDKAVSDLSGLIEHPGWKLYVQILEANIDFLKMQLEEGLDAEGVEETKADIDRIRDKLKICREMRDTPMTTIKKLTTESPEPVNDDPYDIVSPDEPTVDNKEEEV